MSITADEYEWAVLFKYREDFGPSFEVLGTENGKQHKVRGRYSGALRQIDVAIYLRGDSHPRFVVDAKRKLTRRATVEVVDQFVGMLDDLGVNGGALVCPHGWTASAAKRAEAGDVRVELLSVDEALKISCREIARRTLPFDWVFVARWADALIALRTNAEPGIISDVLDALPFEEWLSFAHYAFHRHPDEGVLVLEDVAMYHPDDGHRFQAATVLSEHGRLRQAVLAVVSANEWEKDALEGLGDLDTSD